MNTPSRRIRAGASSRGTGDGPGFAPAVAADPASAPLLDVPDACNAVLSFAFGPPSDPCRRPPDQAPVPATISSRGHFVSRSQPVSVTRIVSENPKSRART